MVEITDEWLSDLGVVTETEDEMDDLLDIAEEELEVRIGTKVLNSLTPEQLKEFENMADDKRQDWIQNIYPEYDLMCTQEYNFISRQVDKSKDKIAMIKSWAED